MVIKLRDDSMIMHKELIVFEASLKADSNVLAFTAKALRLPKSSSVKHIVKAIGLHKT